MIKVRVGGPARSRHSTTMIAGDLDTFSLPDLLQWADLARAQGVLTVEREGVPVWLRLEGRQIREISRAPASSQALHELSERAAHARWLRLPESTEATERALDLFLEPGGRFRFADEPPADDGIEVALELRELVFEGMRHLDEWHKLSITYPDEGARLTATGADAESTLLPVARVILRAAALSLSLGEVRLALRLSRPAILRRVHELVSLGLVTVEGATGGADPVARLVAQSESLAREGQYEEAAHVLRAILESDPSDHRVAGILGDVERRHRESAGGADRSFGGGGARGPRRPLGPAPQRAPTGRLSTGSTAAGT